MWLNSRLCCFLFFCGWFSVPGSFVAAVDGRHTSSSSSASRRKSLADRHLSHTQIATSPLHSLFCTQSTCASLALQRANVRGGIFCRSTALRDCWLVELTSLFFFYVFLVSSVAQVVSFSFFFFCLRPSTGPVAWVPFGRVGWRHSSRAKNDKDETTRSEICDGP